VKFQLCKSISDIEALVELINRAYRGTQGKKRWTTEQHLVTGDRITRSALLDLIGCDDVDFIVGEQWENNIGACIAIQYQGAVAEFGCFAVKPELHGQGYGKQLLQFAEQKAKQKSDLFQVSVVNHNEDLIQFYVRRGYKKTGSVLPYPVDMNVGLPKAEGIALVLLQKPVRANL
jgi:N-acetylglutamate synthase-like GNAT family acetyltransferase